MVECRVCSNHVSTHCRSVVILGLLVCRIQSITRCADDVKYRVSSALSMACIVEKREKNPEKRKKGRKKQKANREGGEKTKKKKRNEIPHPQGLEIFISVPACPARARSEKKSKSHVARARRNGALKKLPHEPPTRPVILNRLPMQRCTKP
jgi:hypothetical protein